jgi:hypothetical protein
MLENTLDFRLKENRKEAFINWFGWSLGIEDCDSALFMTNYLFDRFEFNKEQRLWLIWLYGTTYYLPTTYVIWNEFPDMELVGQDRLTNWNNENYARLRYQTDTKWNKGHLPSQFASYKEWVGDRTQQEAFAEHLTDDPVQNFHNIWKVVNSWHKFGRYTSWFYIQTLHQCTDMNIEVDSLWLHDYSGSRSHRNGLCYAVGKEEWVNEKLDKVQLQYLDAEAAEMLREVKSRFPDTAKQADYFAMETALCSFKKLFRTREGRYLGYYIDRQAEEIKKVEVDGWEGIDWGPMWQAREETLDESYLTDTINKEKMAIFMDSGVIDYKQTPIGLEAFI